MRETLNCDQCGRETTDDQSEVWVLVTNGDSSRICYECDPPDDEFYNERIASESKDIPS